MLSNNSDNVPQWKKDLLQRLQCRSKTTTSVEQLLSTRAPLNSSVTVGRTGQQPSPTCNSSAAVAVSGVTEVAVGRCASQQTCSVNNNNSSKMVQERTWTDHNPIKSYELVSQRMEPEKNVDSDSSEELQYGPGIVNKLKNRYLSLTLRETTARTRPSILHMRKAASLEHIIDNDDEEEDYDDASSEKCKTEGGRLFERKINGSNGISKNVPNRYKNTPRRFDMKRARSVEIISSTDDNCLHSGEARPKRELLHEEMFIKNEGSDKSNMSDKKMSEINDNKAFSNNIGLRLNRPKRLTPVMNEKEKPPADVVRQTKKLFERPELRTKAPVSTGEVAAKVATYKNIIVQTKIGKKPPIKQKPAVLACEKQLTTNKHKPVITNGAAVEQAFQPLKEKSETAPNNIRTQKPFKPPIKLPIKSKLNEVQSEKRNSKPESPDAASLPSPIPDISKVNEHVHKSDHQVNGYPASSLSETPDLILHSSHPYIISAAYKDTTEDFLKAEISHSSKLIDKSKTRTRESPAGNEGIETESIVKKISPETQKKLSASGNSVVFNFSSTPLARSHLPNLQAQSQNNRLPLTQPLQIEVGGANYAENKISHQPKHSPLLFRPRSPQTPNRPSPHLLKQLSPQFKHPPQQLSPQLPKTHSPQLSKPPPQVYKPTSPQISKLPSPQVPKTPSPQVSKPSPQVSKPPSPQISKPSSPQTSKPPYFQSSKQISPQLSKSPSQLSKQQPSHLYKPPSPPVNHSPKLVRLHSPQLPKPNNQQLSQSSPQPAKRDQVQAQHSPVLVIAAQKFEPNKSKIPNQVDKDVNNTAISADVSERVLEKNLINAAKTVERPFSKSIANAEGEKVQTIEVPKPKRTVRPKQEQNSLVFNFTDRKDVPDYVGNHGPIRTGKIERPKPGEGGITFLPGVSLDESVVDDDDEEILRSLEGPPSPCNVTFINDNVLIDGKSSLSKKTKKPKMRIKFVEAGPDIYEYPSESSLLEETQVPATNSAPVGHTVPSLSGSTLANYTPKLSFSSEDFQLGMRPSAPTPPPPNASWETKQDEENPKEPVIHETEQPILFSAGTNSDILF